MTKALKKDGKRCTSCGAALPLGAFNRATKSADGRAPTCRRCMNANRRFRKPVQKSAIRAAVKAGDINQFRKLFDDSKFSNEQLLAMAAQDYNTARKHQGHFEIVEFLLAKGARPHSGMVFEAARTGCQAIVDRLIAGGVELDIFVYAATGDVTRTKKLLQKDPHLARARTSQEFVDYQNFTPLHVCCMSALGRENPAKEKQLLEVGELLVNSGAEINAVETFYSALTVTPLDMAAHTGGNLPLVRLLLTENPTITSFAFANALAHRGRGVEEGVALAELFLENGFKIDTPFKDGTVLHSAANSGMPAGVRWLLDHGADVNARGRMGRTPLHLAAERNMSTRVIEVLFEAGADLNAKDDQGFTALDIAEHHGKTAVANWLRIRQA